MATDESHTFFIGIDEKVMYGSFLHGIFYQTQNHVALNQPRAHEFTSAAEPVSSICIFMVKF